MRKTIAEKILGAHAKRELKAGDIAIADVDFCFGQDGTSSIIIDSFTRLGAKNVFDKSKFCMFLDHSAPSPNTGISAVHTKMRRFAGEKSVRVFDVGSGICHQLMMEEAFVGCGGLVLGADSHTSTYGALNIFSTGVGSTDLAITLASGKNWFKVPETIKVLINGKLPTGVYSKDIALFMVGSIRSHGANYKALEFHGETTKRLSVEARATIANMAVEMGAKCGLFEADKKVLAWFKKRTKKRAMPVSPDEHAVYEGEREFDVSTLSPQVAKPHAVDNTSPVEGVGGTRVDEAFIGTCTNGRVEDLEIAARILKGQSVHPATKLIIAPASREVFLEAARKGLIEIFTESGAAIMAPGCGPCVGTHNGVPADGENVISTANRNFKGRMGNPNANIYLASPATVAASAVAGRITDPRIYAKRLKTL